MLPRMASISDYSTAEIEHFLVEECGNVSATAKRMNVKRSNLADKINRTPELKIARGDIIQSILDKAESNVFTDIAAGDVDTSKYALNTLGKDRGYTTKSEVDANVISGDEAAQRLLAARNRARGAAEGEVAVPVISPEPPKE